ncbi:MAG: hypothetical protein ACI4C1_01060 [Lachnospiraceae bacterium]
MEYTIWELLIFFFAYAFLGWVIEICIEALKTGHLSNAGLFQGPISPIYGVSMLLITLFLRNVEGHYVFQFVACVTVVNAVETISNLLSNRLMNHRMQLHLKEFFEKRFALGTLKGLLYALAVGCIAMLALNLLNPFIYIFCHLIPELVIQIIGIVLSVIFVCDVLTTFYVVHRMKREWKLAKEVSSGLSEARQNLGNQIYCMLKKHIYRVYPELEEKLNDSPGFGVPTKKKFAEGFSIHKLFWIFFIGCLVGDWIETVYVWWVSGVLMSRSSLIYGTFSIVWGFGAVFLTVLLQPVAKKDDRYIFLGGFFLGGTYEYVCSVISEIVFGTVFWDYSHIPLNINGRTNVWYMIAWGVLSVIWVKVVYPRISRLIERIPPMVGLVVTWVLIVLMCLDMLLSAVVLGRYTQRHEGAVSENAIEYFIDYHYPDSFVEFIWPNMKFTEE